MADPPLLQLEYNHLVLPPKLPAEEDPNLDAVEESILDRLRDACSTLTQMEGGLTNIWSSVGRSLALCSKLNLGRLDRSTLLAAFSRLMPETPIVLYVVKQNAAMIVRRDIR